MKWLDGITDSMDMKGDQDLGHSVGSKKYPSQLERRAESFASPRDKD